MSLGCKFCRILQEGDDGGADDEYEDENEGGDDY